MESPPPVEFPRSTNIRASIRTKLPMPDQMELERRFTKVLVSGYIYFLKYSSKSADFVVVWVHRIQLLPGPSPVCSCLYLIMSTP